MPTLECCHLENGRACKAPAEFEIFYAPKFNPCETTHACAAHLAALLTDAHEHRIFRIGPPKNPRTMHFPLL